MFEWKQEYSIGMPHIDAQHQALFRMAMELYAAMSTGQGTKVVARILERLVQYTEQHFTAEERLMRQHKYPGLEEHREQHLALNKKVLEFQADFQGGQTMMTVQIFRFLQNWLQTHIQQSDMAYATFIKAKAA